MEHCPAALQKQVNALDTGRPASAWLQYVLHPSNIQDQSCQTAISECRSPQQLLRHEAAALTGATASNQDYNDVKGSQCRCMQHARVCGTAA